MQMELLVLMRGFDDTFGQNIHARFSYRFDEIEWGRKFAPAFEVEKSGDLLIDLARIGSTVAAPLPEAKRA
jgi:inward rectifier potassium channel